MFARRRYRKELGCGRSQQLPIDPKILAISILETPNSDKINKLIKLMSII
jgi:hypothetical protein